MIYLIGTIGFISGFVLGQMILLRLLKNRPKEELLTNNSIKWIYGTMNWAIAILGAISAVQIYSIYTV